MSDIIFVCPECSQQSRHVLSVLEKETTLLCSNCRVLFRIIPQRMLEFNFLEETHEQHTVVNSPAASAGDATILPAFNIAEKIETEMHEVVDMISHHAPKNQIAMKLFDCVTEIEDIRSALN